MAKSFRSLLNALKKTLGQFDADSKAEKIFFLAQISKSKLPADKFLIEYAELRAKRIKTLTPLASRQDHNLL